jgi:hypothetical protein
VEDLQIRYRFIGLIFAPVAVLAFLPALLAQTPAKSETAMTQAAGPTPDLSGVWVQKPPASARKFAIYSFTGEIPPMTPWAEARYKASKPSFGSLAVADSTDPVNPTTGTDVGCAPPGVPRIYTHPYPFEIVQIPGRVIMIYEFSHFIRQIFTDVREHPQDLSPTWMGDSIGKWEGDTLVIDTIGFNDKTWLDRGGLPHSEDLHVVERIRRVDHDTLEVKITIDDPKAYPKTWGGQLIFGLKPGWKIMEFICEDNVNFLDLQKKAIGQPTK